LEGPGDQASSRSGAVTVTTNHALLALVDAGVWAVWSTLCGYGAHRIPGEYLARDNAVTRLRAFERDGRVYERVLRIKRWKDLLPEAGALFRGGVSKRHIGGHDREHLERFAAATRRAELAHYPILAFGPVFFAFNPWWLALVMVGYAVVANVPCILVQRYNRARLVRVLNRRVPN
jgi:glycosyl-4,4'-diaponeurosporenoate acyltransferase